MRIALLGSPARSNGHPARNGVQKVLGDLRAAAQSWVVVAQFAVGVGVVVGERAPSWAAFESCSWLAHRNSIPFFRLNFRAANQAWTIAPTQTSSRKIR